MGTKRGRAAAIAVTAVAMLAAVGTAGAAASTPKGRGGGGGASTWTAERRAAAIPRDLVIDERGLAYLRGRDGSLRPYGHSTPQLYAVPTSKPTQTAKPRGGSGDGQPPQFGTDRTPADGATLSATTITFTAAITDNVGVRSAALYVATSTGRYQKFSMSGSGGVWTATLSGFSNGGWRWYVVAKDAAANAATSAVWTFTVDTGGSGGGSGAVADATWPGGGNVQTAAGRLYFFMPDNAGRPVGYVCSGTAVTDGTSGRSIVLTAAHCVYDDEHKVFATNAMFIPDQSASGTKTDRDCTNDTYGCWLPTAGVVDVNWTTRTFPDNAAWDYGFYVIPDPGHSGAGSNEALDRVVSPLGIQFDAPTTGQPATALGYSYSQDPLFRYCRDMLGTTGTANWWLAGCGLSGGASGGPWLQPGTTGNEPIFSVNSWGYTNRPGMAGPKLSGTSATCVFALAKAAAENATYSGAC